MEVLAVPGERVRSGNLRARAGPHLVAVGIRNGDRDLARRARQRVAEGRGTVGQHGGVRLRLDIVTDVVDRVERHEAGERAGERAQIAVDRLLLREVVVSCHLVDEVGHARRVEWILICNSLTSRLRNWLEEITEFEPADALLELDDEPGGETVMLNSGSVRRSSAPMRMRFAVVIVVCRSNGWHSEFQARFPAANCLKETAEFAAQASASRTARSVPGKFRKPEDRPRKI